MTVCSKTMSNDARRIQPLLVWNDVPQLISVVLLAKDPSATSTGPRASTEKNLAKNAAPRSPPMIMQRFDISARGGDSTRLTQT